MMRFKTYSRQNNENKEDETGETCGRLGWNYKPLYTVFQAETRKKRIVWGRERVWENVKWIWIEESMRIQIGFSLLATENPVSVTLWTWLLKF
jgi:hypothetical protein